ncbi:MAG TPA: Flp pilus assembly protein CpaB [bacterium]|nr:Flp pilus assembly protein CpaB [bacterium]
MFLLKLKYLIPLAVLAALLATLGTYSYLQNQKTSLQKKEEMVRTVLIAKVNLPVGTRLDETMLQVKEYPPELTPAGSFSQITDLVGRVTKTEIYAGEVVLESRLAAQGSSSGFAAAIPAGMRAMTVAVNVVSGVSGFILPHARVDVLATVSATGDKEESTTTTILENIEVLAVDQTVDTKDNEPITVKSVTLLVTPEQAEKLALGSYEGKLQLVLRNTADQAEATPSGVRLKELINKNKPVQPPPQPRVPRTEAAPAPAVQPQPVQEPPKQVIEVYRSNVRSEVILDEGTAKESKPQKP